MADLSMSITPTALTTAPYSSGRWLAQAPTWKEEVSQAQTNNQTNNKPTKQKNTTHQHAPVAASVNCQLLLGRVLLLIQNVSNHFLPGWKRYSHLDEELCSTLEVCQTVL